MIFVLYHFWGHVFKSTAKSISLLHVISLHTPTKITNFDDVALLYKDILRLDVSMNETLLMKVVDARAYLYEEVERCIFAQKLLPSDEIKQVSFVGIFKSKIYGVLVLETCIQSTYVLVV